MPGLAHFCEHMLFLGTEAFPEEAGGVDPFKSPYTLLGPPARCPFSPLFWLGGFPTKVDYRTEVDTLILSCLLEDLALTPEFLDVPFERQHLSGKHQKSRLILDLKKRRFNQIGFFQENAKLWGQPGLCLASPWHRFACVLFFFRSRRRSTSASSSAMGGSATPPPGIPPPATSSTWPRGFFQDWVPLNRFWRLVFFCLFDAEKRFSPTNKTRWVVCLLVVRAFRGTPFSVGS